MDKNEAARAPFSRFRNSLVLFSLSYSFIAGIFGMLLLQKGLSIAEVGLYYGLYSLFTLLLQAPAGAFSDSYGRKSGMAVSFVAQFLFLASLAFLPINSWMVLIALLPAATDAFFAGASEAYAVDLLGNRKNELTQNLLSSARSWEYAALLLGAAAGGFASSISANAPVFMCMAAAAAGLFYSAFLLREAPSNGKKRMHESIAGSFSLAWSNTNLRAIMVLSFCMGMGFFPLGLYWQFVLAAIAGFGNSEFGLFFALMMLSVMAGLWFSRKISPGWRESAMLFAGMGFFLLSASLLPWAPAVMALILAWEFLWGAYVPVEGAIISRNSPSKIRATVISVKFVAYRLGMGLFGLGVYLAGSSDPRQYWLCGALFLFAGSALALVQSKIKNKG